jgi:uncharacterized protein
MLIDCHTHAFADKIADKAVAQLIEYYNIPTIWGGRLTDLLNAANQARLDAIIMLVAATRPEQVKPANDWILSLAPLSKMELQEKLGLPSVPQIITFGTFHPEDPNWTLEISRLRAAGIKGIKLHPEFQGIDLGDPKLGSFFEAVGSDFVLMIHVGDPVKNPTNFSTPKKVAAILKNFPKLKIIAAHLGGYLFWEEALTELAGKNVYLDTSSSFPYIDSGMLRRIFAKHGTEKILFGSDYPLSSPQHDLEILERFEWLSEAEKGAIMGENCARLLGLNL